MPKYFDEQFEKFKQGFEPHDGPTFAESYSASLRRNAENPVKKGEEAAPAVKDKASDDSLYLGFQVSAETKRRFKVLAANSGLKQRDYFIKLVDEMYDRSKERI